MARQAEYIPAFLMNRRRNIPDVVVQKRKVSGCADSSVKLLPGSSVKNGKFIDDYLPMFASAVFGSRCASYLRSTLIEQRARK